MTANPRPASTVVIGRENNITEELEVLLLLRSDESSFVPSNYVFPGGSIDPEDALESVLSISAEDDEESLLDQFPDKYGNSLLTYKFAAVRETFEECGLLLTNRSGRNPDSQTLDKLLMLREQLYQKKLIFADLLHHFNLTLNNNNIVYLTNFVTPPLSPIRFDAKFFFSEYPPGQNIHIDGFEIVDYTWKTPAAAMQENLAGTLPMVPPTIRVLQMLDGFKNYKNFKRILHSEKPFYQKIN